MKINLKPVAMSRTRTIGVVGLIVIVFIGLLITGLSRFALGATHYTALLSQTAGLRPGETVSVAGVDVGEVRSEKVEQGHVRVDFTLSNGIHLGDQSTAEVRVATLLGTHSLAIHPKGSGDLRGGVIPLDRTSVPYNLQDVVDGASNQLEQLDTNKLAQAFSAVTDVLRASGQNLDPALQGIDRLSKVVVDRNDDFKNLLAGTKSVTDQLAGSASDVIKLMTTSNAFLTELNSRQAAIHKLLVEVQDLSTTVAGLIHDNDARLTPVLDDLGQVLTVLHQREAEIRDALHKVAVGGRYLANASGNGPWIDLNIPDPQGDANYCLKSGGC